MSRPPLLLFPTHYLGNLMLGLPWVMRVLARRSEAVVVLDEAFRPLVSMLPDIDERALYYPRREMARGKGFWHRLRHYLRFVGALREYRGFCLIDMEGERFSGVLSRLSGCRVRIGPAAKRAEWFYSDVRELEYLAHRFNAFGEILGEFGAGEPPPSNLDFRNSPELDGRIQSLLAEHRIERPLAIIHPGASVSYKLWPREHFVQLVPRLTEMGYQAVWVGAGQLDSGTIAGIERELPEPAPINFCNRLALTELAALFLRSRLFIGCDSGPMHLAAATGLPVFALFGPSREAIWAPLGDRSVVLRGEQACAEDCDAWHCGNDYHCLRSLTPEMVLERIAALSDPGSVL